MIICVCAPSAYSEECTKLAADAVFDKNEAFEDAYKEIRKHSPQYLKTIFTTFFKQEY